MCEISPNCGRSICLNERHHWLEIKSQCRGYFAEGEELSSLRTRLNNYIVDMLTEIKGEIA